MAKDARTMRHTGRRCGLTRNRKRWRSALAQVERSSCEAPAVLGRRFASDLAKGGGK
jgi:hypothetical protein